MKKSQKQIMVVALILCIAGVSYLYVASTQAEPESLSLVIKINYADGTTKTFSPTFDLFSFLQPQTILDTSMSEITSITTEVWANFVYVGNPDGWYCEGVLYKDVFPSSVSENYYVSDSVAPPNDVQFMLKSFTITAEELESYNDGWSSGSTQTLVLYTDVYVVMQFPDGDQGLSAGASAEWDFVWRKTNEFQSISISWTPVYG